MSGTEETVGAGDAPAEFMRLLEHIKVTRGFDFTGYKPGSLQRRVRKRMAEAGAKTYADYLDHLQVRPEEFQELFDTLLINVTRFFRNSQTWEQLRSEILPRMLRDIDGVVRVWSAGCATGEEAYSLAMSFAELLGPEGVQNRVKIYATDLDEQALNYARQAVYTEREVEALDPELLARYFKPAGGRYAFRPDLRRAVIFGRHDLVQDAPISRVALLTCRNTLMYLNAETQSRVLRRLHYALRDDGYLVLGKAEMLLSQSHLFVPTDLSRRIFTKVSDTGLRAQLLGVGRDERDRVEQRGDEPLQLGLASFESNPVAEMVLDLSGVVHLFNRQAEQLFHLSPADLGRPFSELELSYRPVELRSLLERVLNERRAVTVGEVEWSRKPDAPATYFDVRLTPVLDARDRMLGVSLTVHDVTEARRLRGELERAKRELDSAYEELQSTNEELETTNEELQSMVEEQETTNEELQSTNEELETTNEELQSTNQELQALNDELRVRTAEMNQVNAFMESILVSLHAGVGVVNSELEVTVWNDRATDLWGLRTEEAVGRSLLNLDMGLPVAELGKPILACLAGETEHEELELAAINRLGRAIRCHVRVSPLRDGKGGTHGVILLMEQLPDEG